MKKQSVRGTSDSINVFFLIFIFIQSTDSSSNGRHAKQKGKYINKNVANGGKKFFALKLLCAFVLRFQLKNATQSQILHSSAYGK